MITEPCPVCEKNFWRTHETKNFMVCGVCNPSAITNEKSALPVVAEVVPDESPEEACACGSKKWWRPHGHSGWRCNACSPAPSRALMAELKDLSPHVVSNELVTYCKPWCPHCGSWMARELVWSDWTISIRCDVCEQEFFDKPSDAPIEHKQYAAVECDCVLPKQTQATSIVI